jgi:hypothetical protein
MSSKSKKPEASGSRRWIISGIALLVVAFGLILLNSDQGSKSASPSATGGDTGGQAGIRDRRSPRIDDRSVDGNESIRSRSSNIRDEESEDSDSATFPLVEGILDDESISESAAATALAGIAMRGDLSLDERYEALAHGLNLDFASFGDFPKDPALPLELAQLYLDGLLNHNEGPILQIEGCVALLNHSEEEIRLQARSQLAFLVHDEALVDFPERLAKAAAERIQLLKESPPEPLLTDESAGGDGFE